MVTHAQIKRVRTYNFPLPGRILFFGVVEQLYRMRDRGIPAALRKLNRMRDCVVLMIFTKKVVTVLLPLASVLLLVAARKDL